MLRMLLVCSHIDMERCSVLTMMAALDPIAKFEIVEKDGAVYIKGEEKEITSGMSLLNIPCKPQGQEKVLVIGG